jgi:hypothetical protein
MNFFRLGREEATKIEEDGPPLEGGSQGWWQGGERRGEGRAKRWKSEGKERR